MLHKVRFDNYGSGPLTASCLDKQRPLNYGKGTVQDEEKFVRHMSALIRLLQDQLENQTMSKDICERIWQKLERFTDDPANCTQTVDGFYRKARNYLDKQTKVVQEQGNKYHKLFLQMGEAEIKARLAVRQRVLDKANKRLEDLTDKVEEKYAKYYKELGTWRYVFTHVQNLASEFETDYVSREMVRAKIVLTCLQDLAEHIMAANGPKNPQRVQGQADRFHQVGTITNCQFRQTDLGLNRVQRIFPNSSGN